MPAVSGLVFLKQLFMYGIGEKRNPMKQPSFSLGRRGVSLVNSKSLAVAFCMIFSDVQQLFPVTEF